MNVHSSERVVHLMNLARARGPRDTWYDLAMGLHAILSILQCPLVLLVPVSTFSIGCLARATLGLVLIPLNLVWLPMVGILFGSSWLWVHVPLTRPVLLVPGVVFANISGLFAAMVPEMGDGEARAMKQAAAGAWPFTIYTWGSS